MRLMIKRNDSDLSELPLIYTVGEEAYLSCNDAEVSGIPGNRIRWVKRDGEDLPSGSRVENGILILPFIKKRDEGSYFCEITPGENTTEEAMVTKIDVQVDEFVPKFTGEPIALPPLNDNEMKYFDVQISINTSAPKGILFETKRVSSGDLLEHPKEVVQHRARINPNGKIRYEYDVGAGREIVETRNSIIPNEWNIIRIQNDKNEVSIQLNDEHTTSKHHSDPLPSLVTGVNHPIYIGGSHTPIDDEDKFEGVISQVIFSGRNVSFGELDIPSTVLNYDACGGAQQCLNQAKCRNLNNQKGFVCECSHKYYGEFCQWRTSRCNDEDCNSGTCVDNDDTWQCVCPIGTTGLRCEQNIDIVKPLGFTSDTSFLAVKKPPNFESIQMKINAKNIEDENILMYFASEYGSTTRKYISLSLIDKQVLLTTKSPQEVKRVESLPLEDGKMIEISVQREGTNLVMNVNGHQVRIDAETAEIKPGTEIFIGGIPPSLHSPEGVVERSFKGCVYELLLNSNEIDLRNGLSSSGDISQCEQEIINQDNVQQTTSTDEESEDELEESSSTSTTTTTVLPITTQSYNFYETMKDNEPEMIEPLTTTESTIPAILPTDDIFDYEYPDLKITSNPDSEVVSPIEIIDESEEEIPENPATVLTPVEATLESLCTNTTCGMNGVCVPMNRTYFECRCKLYYDGPTCNIFKPIEHAARFDGDAFIELSSDEFPHLTSERDETVAFKFKTTQPNGVLLWQGQRPTVSQMEDYISVGIVNGHLHYSYELGGGAAHMVSRERVDDGKEHVARFERRGRRGLLKIDNQEEINGMSTGILAMLNVDGNIFIGGIPDIKKTTGGLFSRNFVGCIADVELNGMRLDLMATAIDGKNVKPCDEWMHRKRWLFRRRFR